MTSLKTAALAVAFLAIAGSATAGIYDCTLKTSSRSYIADRIIIEHAPGASGAQVLDGVIQYYNGAPLDAVLVADNAKRVSFKWVLRDVQNARNQFAGQIVYRATIQKSSGKASIYAKVAGYTNDYTSHGTCQIG